MFERLRIALAAPVLLAAWTGLAGCGTPEIPLSQRSCARQYFGVREILEDGSCDVSVTYEGTEGTDARMRNLADVRLTILRLSDSDATDLSLESLRRIEDLRRVTIIGCRGITEEGLAHLKQATKLEELVLIGTGVTDAGMSHLKGLPLKRLTVDGLTDTGLELLKDLQDLEELDLLHASIGDAGVAHLKELAGLRSLLLVRPRIGEPALERLRDGLPNCRVLVQSSRRRSS